MIGRIFLVLAGILVFGNLIGCSQQTVVPVSDLTTPIKKSAARIVRDGDTLYMIAWEVGIDYRLIAKWNGLRLPYLIEEGQRIRLTPPRKTMVNQGYSDRSLVDDQPNEILNLAEGKEKSIQESKSDSLIITTHENKTSFPWLWPSDGQVITNFSAVKGQNGIDIGFDAGSPVLAAASGKVVYAGAGLRGYGKLLIIQHDEVYLSAYAHNRRLLVEEGIFVQKGKLIAEMGETDAESPRLHFEIRKNGEPVDPLSYLPAR